MNYTEADLPRQLHDGEILTLQDGTEVRFERNGEAKDIYLGDAYVPTVQLFPDTEYTFTAGDAQYRVRALFEDALDVERI
ncbi:MAG: hypothetical protein ACOC24_00965 [Desulfovibrionales bacterium]